MKTTKRGAVDRRTTDRKALPAWVSRALFEAERGLVLHTRTRNTLIRRGLAKTADAPGQRRTWLTDEGRAQIEYERSADRIRRGAAISRAMREANARRKAKAA